MKTMPLSELRRLIRYDHIDGKFYRMYRTIGYKPTGHIKKDGYLYISISGYKWLAHRVAWALYYGEWPDMEIDHKDMVRSNNKISNLRLADNSENNRNKKLQSNNTTGFKGVSFHKQSNLYVAKITINKNTICLGYFKTAEDAGSAYRASAENIHGQFARS